MMRRTMRRTGVMVAGAGIALLWGATLAGGCGGDVETDGGGGHGASSTGVGNQGGTATGTGGTGGGSQVFDCTTPAERIDVLLSIDNSRSMADKQEILSLAVPELVDQLVNPACIPDSGSGSPVVPGGPLDPCPDGYHRMFAPPLDMHVGVISSSLGDHGGDVCPSDLSYGDNDDRAHLLTRTATGGTVATYEGLGFLAWDPSQHLSPPGEQSPLELSDDLRALVEGAGEVGCGFEAQLESWYRFLVEPNPYQTIEESGGTAVMQGTDTVLLEQRADFLRPDSLLLIVMLSDENDCSIRDGSQYFYAAKSQSGSGQYHLPKPQITCETDPLDECCRSCGQSDDGCPPKGAECEGSLDVLSDPINLRCFDQKRRFGIDFLQPIDRYVTGLSSGVVADRDGNVVANPVFSDLDPSDDLTAIREPGLVWVAGIVGVPWQDIARRNQDGLPDLINGQSDEGEPVGGYQSDEDMQSLGTWDLILGAIENYGEPLDPLMRESIDPRTGTHPVTGDPIAAPNAGFMANPINGHEWSDPLLDQRNDLQYACIFPLDSARDCSSGSGEVACECSDESNDNPLCQAPDGSFGTTQYQAKAYPGRRELWFLREMRNRGIVGSICPAQQSDDTRVDFGYRPSIDAIVERVLHCL